MKVMKMVDLREGDRVEVLEKDGFVRIQGRIVKKEVSIDLGRSVTRSASAGDGTAAVKEYVDQVLSPGERRTSVKQYIDLILDSGSRIRKILYQPSDGM